MVRYENIDIFTDDYSKSINKIYQQVLKDVFQTKTTSEIQPLQFTDDKSNAYIAISDVYKTEVLKIFSIYLQ